MLDPKTGTRVSDPNHYHARFYVGCDLSDPRNAALLTMKAGRDRFVFRGRIGNMLDADWELVRVFIVDAHVVRPAP
jgi:hypothetical protein